MSGRFFVGIGTEEIGPESGPLAPDRVLVVRTGPESEADCKVILTANRSLIIEAAQKYGTRKPLKVVIPSGQCAADFGAALDQLFSLQKSEEEDEPDE